MKEIQNYKTAESVERDLKILDLRRKIALEEMKGLKEDYKNDLRPMNWMNSGVKWAGKFFGMYVLKKFIK